MCGIAGILSLADGPPPAIDELSRMIGALRHRGPDDLGIYRDAHVGLAHARLSIIDLEGGKQPLCDASGEIWVSYNGEIYNHVELRAELEARGYTFRTRSDTEVLVVAYRAFGDACVERFEGQFAFALWDAAEADGCCSRAIASACARSTSRSSGVAWRSRRRSRRSSSSTTCRARSIPRGSRRCSPSGRRSRRARRFQAFPRSGPATSR